MRIRRVLCGLVLALLGCLASIIAPPGLRAEAPIAVSGPSYPCADKWPAYIQEMHGYLEGGQQHFWQGFQNLPSYVIYDAIGGVFISNQGSARRFLTNRGLVVDPGNSELSFGGSYFRDRQAMLDLASELETAAARGGAGAPVRVPVLEYSACLARYLASRAQPAGNIDLASSRGPSPAPVSPAPQPVPTVGANPDGALVDLVHGLAAAPSSETGDVWKKCITFQSEPKIGIQDEWSLTNRCLVPVIVSYCFKPNTPAAGDRKLCLRREYTTQEIAAGSKLDFPFTLIEEGEPMSDGTLAGPAVLTVLGFACANGKFPDASFKDGEFKSFGC